MKTKLLIPTFALLLLAAIGCSDVYKVIYTDRSQDVDFMKYKTFSWLPHDDKQNSPYHNQIIENNTKNYFTHEFFVRGLTLNVDTPDVLMQLLMTAVDTQKTEQVANPSPTQNSYNNSYANPYNNSYNYNPSNNPYANPYNNQYNYNPYNNQATSPQNPYYNPNPNQYNYNRPPNYNNNYSPGYTTRIIKYTESTITLNVIDRKSNKIVWTSVVGADLYEPSQMQNNLHPAVHRILDSYPIKPITPVKHKED
jgi:hypothetical protein